MALYGLPTDYEAPFVDVYRNTPEQEADRIVGIGAARLLAWHERTRRDTHPGTYGQTDHELTAWIALHLKQGTEPAQYRNPTDAEVRAHNAKIDALRRLRAQLADAGTGGR